MAEQDFRDALAERLGQRPRLKLKPLSDEQRARAQANQEVAKQAKAEQEKAQAGFFTRFDAARGSAALRFADSVSKHVEELGVDLEALKGLLTRTVRGIAEGDVTFQDGQQNGSIKFTIRLSVAVAQFGEGLQVKNVGGTFKSIIGDVNPSGKEIVVFHVL